MSACNDALRYASIGWHVFPCTREKTPYVSRGFHRATVDADQIREWWAKWPDARIGVACLASGLVVVDCDTKHGIDGVGNWERLCDDHGSDNNGLAAATPSGGRHFVFLRPDFPTKTVNNVVTGSGIDVRGDGGYFLVPSCVEPGREWIVGDPFEVGDDGSTHISEPAKWVAELVRASSPSGMSAGGDTGGTPISDRKVADIRDAIQHIDCDPHDTWIRVGMALKSTGGGSQAFGLWCEWAQGSHKYEELEHRRRWRSLREYRWDGSEITLGTLYHMAKEAGWKPSLEQEALVEEPTDDDYVAPVPAAEKPFPRHLLNVPGVLGELADWIRDSGLREQPSLALASSITVCAAIMGRRCATPTNLRSNVYIVGVGDTACGKESGVSEPVTILKLAGLERFLGTSDWTSAAAIRGSLSKSASQVCLVDEFGKWLRRVSGDRVPPHLQGVKDMLMQSYSRASGVMLGVAYANQRDNPQVDILEPNLCVYGASTPDELFGALDHGAITDGFLNRILFFHVDDRLPPMRELDLMVEGDREKLRDQLFQSLRELEVATRPEGELVEVTNDGSTKTGCRVVPWTPEARAKWRTIQQRCDDRMRELRDQGSQIAELWVRAAAHVAKLAMIRGVTDDPTQPVDVHHVDWADELVSWSTERTAAVCAAHVADNSNEATTKRVMRIIEKAGQDGLSLSQLTRATQWLRRSERIDVLRTLQEGGQVQESTRATRTKPMRTYVAAGRYFNPSGDTSTGSNDASIGSE